MVKTEYPQTKTSMALMKHICGAPISREEVLLRLKEFPETYREFRRLSETFQEELIAFCMGVRGVKMTYDPFFKHIFNPDVFPEYLEDFLCACLGEPVTILDVLPNESLRLSAEASLLIADLLVRLDSGVIVNVEIQRAGYYFPGARCACYSSDLVMRQYSKLRAQKNAERKRFSYRDVKKVYTIVLMQSSTKEFHRLPNVYFHHAKQTFQSGLNLDLLQEYILIPLDIFLQIPHNTLSRLDAWLTFVASDRISDIERVCAAYPEFCKLYREIFRFRYHPKELVSMFSEALRMLDEGTIEYMIDDMKRELDKLTQECDTVRQACDAAMQERDDAMQERDDAMRKFEEALAAKNSEAEAHRKEIEELRTRLALLENQSGEIRETLPHPEAF